MEEQTRSRERIQEKHAKGASINVKDAAGKCPHCGAGLEREDYEFCPVCGGKLVDYCTFCGAAMNPGDMDCPECGMPSDGVVCQGCGTRNLRSFCRSCGQPLSRAARKAVEKAKQDPKVHETAQILVKIAELQAELDAQTPEDEEETAAEPTEGELRLRELMAKVGFTPAQMPKPGRRKMGRSREEVLKEYRKAVEDANKIMETMLPPAGMTPQEQRNYFTARKVAVTEVIEERWYGIPYEETLGWECNKCHVLHNNPQECSVAEFGGKWITCSRCKVVEEGTPGAQMFTNTIERKVYKRL